MSLATMTPPKTDQAFFDFLVPVTKELLRVDEVMTILRMEKDTVYALVDSGKLEAHQSDGRRCHYRITRRSVVAHLALTAKYEPTDFLDTILRLIARLPSGQRADLTKRIQTL
jgi:excisionase family DNA binding protein